MSLVILIKAAMATEREVETAKGMRKFKEQVGFIQIDDETRKIRVPLNRDQAPYPVGSYTLSDSSFTVSRFHDLEINRFEFGLVPVRQAMPQPAAKAI